MDSFDLAFKCEFSNTKIQTHPEPQYYRLNLNESNENLFKTANNPFNFKIKSLPSIKLKESLCLMYEEASLLIYSIFIVLNLEILRHFFLNLVLTVSMFFMKIILTIL